MTNGNSEYTAYILHSGLNSSDIDEVKNSTSMDIVFIKIDSNDFSDFPKNLRYPNEMYYRLLAYKYLPANIDRILYLDPDTIVINSLCDFYNCDFHGNYLVACTHIKKLLNKFNRDRLHVEENVPYINSGVMLMNLNGMRKDDKREEVKKFVEEMGNRLALPDQDIIMAVYGSKILLEDCMKYNLSERMLIFWNADPQNNKIDLEWIKKNSVIIHYCGRNKPWKKGYIGILDTFWNKYYEK
jgi:lipopolysaccharide biosynthesis glycosyltransferase